MVNLEDGGGNTLKPPLLEYWKPPKAVVFTHEPVVSPKKKGIDYSRNDLAFDIKEETGSSTEVSSDESNSGSNFIDEDTSGGGNRFTWADSTTTLVGIKETESGSLKSVPWGYDQKSKDRIRISELEVIRNMSSPSPKYRLNDEDTLKPHWWQIQHWSRKKLAFLGVGVAVVIAVVVAVVVEIEKANRYPDYSALNYSMVDRYSGTSFFDNFDYYTDTDPTNGFVQYVDERTATSGNLTYAGSSSAVLRVDTSDKNAIRGRESVRITSKDTWDNGLFIFDVIHTPYGCATWPAIWLTDVPNWPTNGEIDVMEQVNQGADGIIMTLHTTDDCTMKVKRKETGKVSATNCWNETDSNAGCGVTGTDDTYGEAFNKEGGGIMAMELRPAGIRIWQFLRGSIPTDITNHSPDPSTWGEALADFPNTHCDITSHFKNQTIVVNIDICGDWAGATSVYNDEDSCPGTCSEYAATNATEFETAYFEFGNFTVYQAASLN